MRLPARQSAGSRSHSTQRVPSHQRCQIVPSRPGAQTSMRSAAHELADGRPGQLATERLPVVPVRAIPVTVPELAVGEDREDLELVDIPRGCGGRGGEGAAEGLRFLPRVALADTMHKTPVRTDPEEVDPAGGPGHR